MLSREHIETAKGVFRDLGISSEAPDEPPPIIGSDDYFLEAETERTNIDISQIPHTIAEWLGSDLPAPDCVMGAWLTTTNRVIIPAPPTTEHDGMTAMTLLCL
jgi:hypothetical protein